MQYWGMTFTPHMAPGRNQTQATLLGGELSRKLYLYTVSNSYKNMFFHRAIPASPKTSVPCVDAVSEHMIEFSKLPGAFGALRKERYFWLEFQLICHNFPNVSVDIPNFKVKQSSDVRLPVFTKSTLSISF